MTHFVRFNKSGTLSLKQDCSYNGETEGGQPYHLEEKAKKLLKIREKEPEQEQEFNVTRCQKDSLAVGQFS